MRKFIGLLFGLAMLSVAVVAQSEERILYPTITSENADSLAIIMRTSEDDWGEGDSFNRRYATTFAFSPDSTRLAIAIDPHITIVDSHTGQLLGRIEKEDNRARHRSFGMIFSADGNLLATTGDGRLTIWDTNGMEPLLTDPISISNTIVELNQMSFSLDNSTFYAYGNGVLQVWDVSQQREIDRRQYCPLFHFMNNLALCSSQNTTLAYDFIDLTQLEVIETVAIPNVTRSETQASALSPDKKIFGFYAFASNDAGSSERFYYRLDLENQVLLDPIPVDYDRPSNFIINPTGTLIGAGNPDNELVIIDVLDGETIIAFPSQAWWHYSYMTFSPDGSLFAVGNFDADAIDIYAVSDCYVSTDREVNLRTDPSTNSELAAVMQESDRLAVDGQTQEGTHTWWHLAIGLWVRSDVVSEHGQGCTTVNLLD